MRLGSLSHFWILIVRYFPFYSLQNGHFPFFHFTTSQRPTLCTTSWVPDYFMHYRLALCTMVHKGDLCPDVGVAHDIFHFVGVHKEHAKTDTFCPYLMGHISDHKSIIFLWLYRMSDAQEDVACSLYQIFFDSV